MKSIFISGIKGNMGSRYARILQKLKVNVYGSDDNSSFMEQASFCKRKGIDGIIIATPTATHLDAINIFGNFCNAPMLVEKPIAKAKIVSPRFHVTMVNQYDYLVREDSVGLSSYNYFKTGGDGLLWDCINIIGMARSSVKINNNSPIWRCMINGQRLHIQDMDRAYIHMLRDWVDDPIPNPEYIMLAHAKVWEMIKEQENKHRANKVEVGTKVIPILGSTND